LLQAAQHAALPSRRPMVRQPVGVFHRIS